MSHQQPSSSSYSLGAPVDFAQSSNPSAPHQSTMNHDQTEGGDDYVHRPSTSAPFNHPYANADEGGYHAVTSDAPAPASPSVSTRSLSHSQAQAHSQGFTPASNAPPMPYHANANANANATGGLNIAHGEETASGANSEAVKAVNTRPAEVAYAGEHGGEAGYGPGRVEGHGSGGPAAAPASTRSESDRSMSEKKKLAAAGAGGAALGAGAGAAAGAHGGPGGPGGPGGRPQLDKYAYGFFDPQMAPFRKIVAKIIGGGMMILIILMWLCLPFYWGSLWETNVYTNHLTVRIVNRDSGEIGSFVTSALTAENLRPALGYFQSDASDFPTDQDVIDNLLDDGVWGAVIIGNDATANLLSARQNGNSSYNGSQVIQVYFSQARFENAVNAYLVPYLQQSLGMITGEYNARSNAEYLGANAGNDTAIGLLARAPQTMSQPVFFTMNNLRPYNQPVATAITLVGLIYMLIFAFILTMMNNAAREIISPFMTTKAYLAYRILLPLTLYLPLSLLFAMVSLPFKVHFDAHFTYAGGFFLWFFTLFLGMSSVGLATEFAVTLLGAQFTGFFLIPLIIANVSVSSFPHELQPWIFRYGVAMPFYNVSRVVRTIIFNTKNEIAMNLGILLAWIVFSMITITLATWLMRRKAVNAHRMSKIRTETEAEKAEEHEEAFHARRGEFAQEDTYQARGVDTRDD